MKRDHAFRERQSLALNSAVAQRLASEPDAVIEHARSTLARWKSLPGVWCVDLGKWEAILAQTDSNAVRSEVQHLLTGDSELERYPWASWIYLVAFLEFATFLIGSLCSWWGCWWTFPFGDLV